MRSRGCSHYRSADATGTVVHAIYRGGVAGNTNEPARCGVVLNALSQALPGRIPRELRHVTGGPGGTRTKGERGILRDRRRRMRRRAGLLRRVRRPSNEKLDTPRGHRAQTAACGRSRGTHGERAGTRRRGILRLIEALADVVGTLLGDRRDRTLRLNDGSLEVCATIVTNQLRTRSRAV